MKQHIFFIGIGGIGISALARYYLQAGWKVSGSDAKNSALLEALEAEGCRIFIGHAAENIDNTVTRVVYSDAIITKPDLSVEAQIYANPELAQARDANISHVSYPVALGELFNAKQGIAIAGSHGKSTTTAMTAITLAQWDDAVTSPGCSVIVGTQVPQFDHKNMHYEPAEYFVIEACEYKRSFLQYHPYITVITTIDFDHGDYYADMDDYLSAFQSLVDQTRGYVIVSEDDVHAAKLNIPQEKKIVVGATTISYHVLSENICCGPTTVYTEPKTLPMSDISLQLPGEHILQDARLAYTVAKLCGMDDESILRRLASYTGSWRRFENIGTTAHGNILFSDYAHHPKEILLTGKAFREAYPEKKFLVVFQPHQYARTREFLKEFGGVFSFADQLIIPNIYFSRDKEADVSWMTVEKLIAEIAQNPLSSQGKPDGWIQYGNGLENTATLIEQYDATHENTSIIVLLGAGDIDTLRFQIATGR